MSESDVEQKVLYPFLTNPSYGGIPAQWIRTKDYMVPTEIDKIAGKLRGYIPDYSVWLSGLPLLIVEAKAPDVRVEAGLREARLYAGEINKRYPPSVNPIAFVISCNGEQIALTEWDSETEAFIADIKDVAIGSSALEFVQNTIGKRAIEARFGRLRSHFESEAFVRTVSFMGGRTRLGEQLGVNEFAKQLFPIVTKYFAKEADEDPDEVIDRAYVSSEEVTSYNSALDAYLKDRTKNLVGNQLEPIVTGRSSASTVSTEILKFSQNPTFFGRVQLLVGAVGSGKSIFIRRYYRRLMPREVADRTHWTFINFNLMQPGSKDAFRQWVTREFITSFEKESGIDIFDLRQIEKIFGVELNRFDKGPMSLIKKLDPAQYATKKAEMLTTLVSDSVAFSAAIARHYAGERGKGFVIVFDNVDKRSRDDQLMIFETAQWFRELTHALVIVTLRDSTFATYRDEPPLDAFINAINFYIRPPRFAQMIRKRLEVVLDILPYDKGLEKRQQYALEGGQSIVYPVSKLGEFLMSIYLSLFETRSARMAACLEALVAKNARQALGMFADILISPHIPASQITGAALFSDRSRIKEHVVIKCLMRGRNRFFNGQSDYIKNIIDSHGDYKRPTNFLYADILEFLIRNRKQQIDFRQEGLALSHTVLNRMGQLGYDEDDALVALRQLVKWGLIEPDSLVIDDITADEPVRLHASGFVHMRFLLQRPEFLTGVTPSMGFASRDVAQQIGALWAGLGRQDDISLNTRRRMLDILEDYFQQEFEKRCRRHAFYRELGHGGKTVVESIGEAKRSLNLVSKE